MHNKRVELRVNHGWAESLGMNREELKSILQRNAEPVERQPGCPADDELASFMDGGLSEQGHENFTIHLADCAYCIERVGMLGRARDEDTPVQVPELLIARSRKLAALSQTPVEGKNAWGTITRWSAAAVVVLAIGLVVRQAPGPAPATGPADRPAQDYRETRNINPGAAGPRVLWPREGMTVVTADAVFNWAPVQESLYYQVRIVSDEGDLIWQERVVGTQWELPRELSLAHGAEYFVRVDAFLTDAKSLNSDYVLFRAGEHR